MSTLAEIEAAMGQLPPAELEQLYLSLSARMKRQLLPSQRIPLGNHSVLDIPTVSVGKILKPLTRDDDILGEMLEGRKF